MLYVFIRGSNVNDEFKKVVLLWPLSLVLFATAYEKIGSATHSQEDVIWLKLLGVLLGLLFLGSLIGVPMWQQSRRTRAFCAMAELFSQGRYLETIESAARARRLWPNWEGPTLLSATSELLLWRLNSARRSFSRLLNMAHDFRIEREVLSRVLVADELAGDAERARKRIERARLPEEYLTLPRMIRASREGNHELVCELSGTNSTVAPEFAPLADALLAWAEEGQSRRAINKVAILGETGLEQVEKAWPEFAEFLKRAEQA